ncbi:MULTISPECIES: DUF4290 domain-containing protein [Arcicella]|uniref:DUF4290 domain-containing protein n=1 Tax=Arcicella aquatica TaxID=217141 RepID=A0ABU5QUQ3_9BACT|nr:MULTISPECIES: DUF4290 domain-containing protein [Arcicella]MDR6563456.1 hypothetical protein [Arcicella sp. BE51]MDR6813432.1 hypothetical protein [Arcicella sp. BE140]MDR6824745.1 hypothetical protein [Arcicella sp. BE139]MEA5260843.1 DUF4290 domain-containing protein [Arcicella aquatica]
MNKYSYFCLLARAIHDEYRNRPYYIMKEYGTNVQKLVNHILTVQDREKRTKYAYLLVELMRQVHPNMRDTQDYTNKLWDDLYIMSKFKLDVDSPFPPPSPDAVGKLPKTVPYNTHQLRYRYYGRNVELLIARAIAETDDNEKRILVAHIARLMKTFYQNWNREVVDDEVIWGHILEISNNTLAPIVHAISGHSSLGNLRNANNRPTPPNTHVSSNNGGRNDGRNNNSGGRQNFGGRNDGNRSGDPRNNGGRSDNRNNNNGRNDNRNNNNNNSNNRNRR